MKSTSNIKRPKINLEMSFFDRILEISGWSVLGLTWVLTIYFYRILPDIIPMHFNFSGEADNFGNKSTVFLLPILGTVLFLGMTILNHFPHVFNYPVKITIENARNQYTMATRMIRLLKLIVLLVFSMIIWLTISSAVDNPTRTGIWLIPVILMIVNLPLIIYIIRSIRVK